MLKVGTKALIMSAFHPLVYLLGSSSRSFQHTPEDLQIKIIHRLKIEGINFFRFYNKVSALGELLLIIFTPPQQ
jgi:hypothetical protein